MEITVPEYNRKVQEWVDSKWPSGAPCPMCQTSSGWELGQLVDMLIRTDIVGTPRGRSIPAVPLFCNNCGHIVLLNALKLGVVISIGNSNG